jgi:hypothetical protein
LTDSPVKPKLASRQKSNYTGKRAFFISPLAAESPWENLPCYDELATGRGVYAYVGGNPVNEIDPRGLSGNGTGYGPTQFNPYALPLGTIVMSWGANGALGLQGIDVTSGVYLNLDTLQSGLLVTKGQCGAGAGFMAGASIGFITGPLSNVEGIFTNMNMAVGPASITSYTNGNGQWSGGAIGFGPGFGLTSTTTNTTLY